jgi:integrase
MEEIAAFFAAIELRALLDGSPGESPSVRPVRLATAALLYTGRRASALLSARWEDVDLDGATWTIPVADRVVVAGEVTPRRWAEPGPPVVPLCPTAVSIFRMLRAEAPASPWIATMAAQRAEEPPARIDAKAIVREFESLQESGRLTLASPATIPDLRRTWLRWAGELGIQVERFEHGYGHARAVRAAEPRIRADLYEQGVRLELLEEATARVGTAFDRVLRGDTVKAGSVRLGRRRRARPERSD